MPRLKQHNTQMVTPTTNPAITKVVLSVDEFAESIGVSRTTAYGLMVSGEVKWVKIGTRRLILVSERDAFLVRLAAKIH